MVDITGWQHCQRAIGADGGCLEKGRQIPENKAGHPLCLHHGLLQPATVGGPITKVSTSCNVRWLIGGVGCLGFGSTAGEEVAQGLLNLCGWHTWGFVLVLVAMA